VKGIMFKPDMIKAIVEGRKTQTRRVIKPQPPSDAIDVFGWFAPEIQSNKAPEGLWMEDKNGLKFLQKPRYQVGEVVYIKETLYRHPYLDEAGYMLDQTPVFINQTIGDCLKWRWQKDILTGMFMPQEAARYFIRITDVRAERLQEISLADIYAEGCPLEKATVFTDPESGYQLKSDAYEWFNDIWNSINKPPYDWNNNPWVWVYSFERLNNAEK